MSGEVMYLNEFKATEGPDFMVQFFIQTETDDTQISVIVLSEQELYIEINDQTLNKRTSTISLSGESLVKFYNSIAAAKNFLKAVK